MGLLDGLTTNGLPDVSGGLRVRRVRQCIGRRLRVRQQRPPVYAAARGRTAHGAAVVDGNGGGPGLGVGGPRHVEPSDIADIQASFPLALLVVLVEQFAGMAAPGAKPSAPLARVMSGSSKPIVNGLWLVLIGKEDREGMRILPLRAEMRSHGGA